jgi:histidinol-phosphate aminotransferase
MSNWPSWLPLRDELKTLTPYGAPQLRDVIQLHTNENPFDLPLEVQGAIVSEIKEVAGNLNRYPDRDAVRLRSKLAQYVNAANRSSFSVENIWVANGSNEILQTLFLACGGSQRSALGFTPSYSVHPLIAKITGTTWIEGKRSDAFAVDVKLAMQQIATEKPALVLLTTPNNPSGTSTPLEDIEQLALACSQVGALLVVDEAYAEFSTEASAASLIAAFPHVVSSRTMSKAFAFAGVRLGYLVAHPSVIDAALVTRLPYHLSALTQAAAEVAVDHAALMQSGIEELLSERELLVRGIERAGWKCLQSSANFLLFSGFHRSSKEIWQEFLDRGILLRDVGLEGYLRVTVGTSLENKHFLNALQEIAQ